MKNNITFLWDNLADFSEMTASSTAGNLSTDYLQMPERWKVWRSTQGDQQTLSITLPPNQMVQAIAVVDHNLAQKGSLIIQGHSKTDNVNITVKPHTISGVGSNAILLHILPYPVRIQQWQLTFINPTDNYTQCSRIYLGAIWQPKYDIEYGWTLGNINHTKGIESRGGQLYQQPKQCQISLECNFELFPERDRDTLCVKYTEIGDYSPFIVCLNPNAPTLTTFYSRFQEMQITRTHHRFSQVPMKLIEVL
jgi:hypothetical protein